MTRRHPTCCVSLPPRYLGSAFQQQVRFPGIIDPREQFYTDLLAETNKWKDNGDHKDICLDANEDVRSDDTVAFFASLDIKELILEKHPKHAPPETCSKNQNF